MTSPYNDLPEGKQGWGAGLRGNYIKDIEPIDGDRCLCKRSYNDNAKVLRLAALRRDFHTGKWIIRGWISRSGETYRIRLFNNGYIEGYLKMGDNEQEAERLLRHLITENFI